MPAPVAAPGTRPPAPSVPAQALDRARALLERAFGLPSAERPGGPAPAPNRPRGLAAAAAALVAPFLTGDAELNLAKLRGRVPADVDGRDWQMAGAAFERWNARWRVPSTWTPGQVGRSIGEAAVLHDRLSAGRISPRQFGDAMSRLVRRIDGEVQPPAIRSVAGPRRPADPPPSRPADPPPSGLADPARLGDPAALRRRQAAQRGSDAVAALGRAIRSHGEAPSAARRSLLNDAYALARSLHARDGARHWTPATRHGFAAYAPQAVRALYGAPGVTPPASPIAPPRTAGPRVPSPPRPGVPAQESRVTHTRGPGASTGAAADALEREALARHARAVENARRIVHERSRTLLPGGPSVAELAREVYRAMHPELQAAGLGEDDFVARAQAPGRIAGMHRGGRIGASGSGASGGPARPGQPGDGGEADPVHAAAAPRITLAQMRDAYPASSDLLDRPGRRERLEALEREGWRFALEPRRAGEPIGDTIHAVPGSKVLLLPDVATTALANPLIGPALDRAIGAARSLVRAFEGPPLVPPFEAASMLPARRAEDAANGVLYFPPGEARAHRLLIGRDGGLLAADGRTAIDSGGTTTRLGGPGRMIVVLDMQGRLYGGSGAGRVYHASFVAGADVAFAGEIEVRDGRIRTITDGSGHYQPGLVHTLQFLQWLRQQGVDLTQVRIFLHTDLGDATGPTLF
jgi:hypothetical protein